MVGYRWQSCLSFLRRADLPFIWNGLVAIYFWPSVSKKNPPRAATMQQGLCPYWWQLKTLCWYMALNGFLSVWGDIGLCHWPRRWVDGAQCKCKHWFFLKLFLWLDLLGFPVNLSGDWLFPNIKRWKLSNAQVVGEGEIVRCYTTLFRSLMVGYRWQSCLSFLRRADLPFIWNGLVAILEWAVAHVDRKSVV